MISLCGLSIDGVHAREILAYGGRDLDAVHIKSSLCE